MTSSGHATIYVASRLVADAETVLSPGAVAVENGVILAAGSPADVERETPARFDRLDLPGLAILPGLVNAHTHLSIPRLADRDKPPAPSTLPFVEWILRVIEWKRNAPPGEFANNVGIASREAIPTLFANSPGGAFRFHSMTRRIHSTKGSVEGAGGLSRSASRGMDRCVWALTSPGRMASPGRSKRSNRAGVSLSTSAGDPAARITPFSTATAPGDNTVSASATRREAT
ncbi:MAG: hypothetical protein E4G97_07860 [Deltaproteobacteria bacterium]|nr:MAG: hypothetical protein E4G97_07860 [Deltaproteobacteria bacterium]